ncbi:Sec-independent protein translocase protein TatB [Polaromonas sp. YR568]|uniref:Sec-independent protein translocase protein TatB n=1 Tax=Polaromonas sp. YR568 TaxID=1855301 RepID=UPI003137F0B9
MIDLGISKIALIGAVALIVIGPEKLPRVARTVGTLLGKAQRYVADVKQEVNRSMELDELKKMKETVEGAARDVESSIQTNASDFEKSWTETTGEIMGEAGGVDSNGNSIGFDLPPEYRHPKKKWRIKQGAMPQWYKARSGVRTKAQSGAARVARFRPRPTQRPNA